MDVHVGESERGHSSAGNRRHRCMPLQWGRGVAGFCSRSRHLVGATPLGPTQPPHQPTGNVARLQVHRLAVLLHRRVHALHVEERVAQRVVHLRRQGGGVAAVRRLRESTSARAAMSEQARGHSWAASELRCPACLAALLGRYDPPRWLPAPQKHTLHPASLAVPPPHHTATHLRQLLGLPLPALLRLLQVLGGLGVQLLAQQDHAQLKVVLDCVGGGGGGSASVSCQLRERLRALPSRAGHRRQACR